MKVCIVDIQKPREGSGSGIGEYTYHLAKGLKDKKDVEVSEFYAVPKVGRFDIKNLLYINTLFKAKLASLAKEDFDIIHITNHEIGFAARILKQKGTKAKVITTIHDAIRMQKDYPHGIMQRSYNALVKSSIRDACESSDMILFDSTNTKSDISKAFKYKSGIVVPLGIREKLLAKPRKKVRKAIFSVGYIGSFGSNKNVISILKVAKLFDNKNNIKFEIYGSGPEYKNLIMFKNKNNIQNVEFKGFAPENKLIDIYDSFDVFFFPSMHEGFGLPIIEAQARGLPTIIFKNARIPKETRKECIEIKDENEAKSMILRLKNKEYSRGKMESALKYARGFTWEKVLQRVYNIYNDILGK